MGEPYEEQAQKLQSKVDKIKTLSVINNAHNLGTGLTPPPKRNDEDDNQIAIVKALDQYPRIQAIFLEARGLMYDEKQRKIVQISRPFMNVHGAWKLVSELLKISLADWSNFEEDRIPNYLVHFFSEIYPYFTFWHEDYDLDPKDFDYVKTTLQMFLLVCFYKAKGGKQLNVLGKTYSEDFLGRVMKDEGQQRKREGVLDRWNPFKKIN